MAANVRGIGLALLAPHVRWQPLNALVPIRYPMWLALPAYALESFPHFRRAMFVSTAAQPRTKCTIRPAMAVNVLDSMTISRIAIVVLPLSTIGFKPLQPQAFAAHMVVIHAQLLELVAML